MRFAYIDSNGNEVPIPSVDALALRIELGAIHEETELYDAHADQWGPAHTHEIYHTLVRASAGGDQGFVAPPPPVVAPPAPPKTAEEPPRAEPPKAEPSKPKPPRADKGPKDKPAPPSKSTKKPEPKSDDKSFGLTLADAPDGEPELDMAPPAPPAGGVSSDTSEDPFDFGDLGGGLELESDFSPANAPMDFAGGGAPGGGGADTSMDFGGGLDLEEPMSEFSPDAPPGWMEAGPDSDDADVMDFSSVAADSATEEARPTPDNGSKRQTRTKPSPPKFKRRRNLVGPLLGVLLLLSLGVGGYVAWPIVSARLAADDPPEQPGSRLPDIPEELLPAMREASDAAFASAFREARGAATNGLASPPRDWLAGVYLGNASRYESVETFWADIENVLEALRALDVAGFHAHYERSLAAVSVPEESRALVAERADSGFVAAAADREAVYSLVDDLVESALGLHEFLVVNEASIDYVPASSMTADPVLEARPATPEIRNGLNAWIERVYRALDSLDYLSQVTAEGLWSIVLERVQDLGVH
jgi:hypothetical protein